MTNTATPRDRALRAGVRVEIVTVVWMIIEAAVAIGSGIVVRSILLTAFGIDSVIELLSAGILLWRLRAEIRGDSSEHVERRASWISGTLLVLLCCYVIVASIAGLVKHVGPDTSRLGFAISAAAVVLMPLLATWKKRINRVIQSGALRADIAETLACAYMATFVLIGLILNTTLHWWWTDSVLSLGLLFWLGHEAKEALEAARGNDAGE
jgi:divalent metal cation (Fe/Co/Zn/Cd) transporter